MLDSGLTDVVYSNHESGLTEPNAKPSRAGDTGRQPRQRAEREKMYYAIQVIGCGKNRRYCIQQVLDNHRGTNPTTGRSYRTLEQAQEIAASLGYQIEKMGDYWEII